MNKSQTENKIRDIDTSSDESLFAAIKIWVNRVRHISGELLSLLELEIKLFTKNVLIIFIISLLTILLLMTAWIALIASGIAFLVELGYTLSSSILLIAGITSLVAVISFLFIIHIYRNIKFKSIKLLHTNPSRVFSGSEK